MTRLRVRDLWGSRRFRVRLSPSARLAQFSFGPTDPPRRPKPPGIFGYPPVSRQAARPAADAGGSAKCQQTRAFLLGSA
jgi:hypothetical protein